MRPVICLLRPALCSPCVGSGRVGVLETPKAPPGWLWLAVVAVAGGCGSESSVLEEAPPGLVVEEIDEAGSELGFEPGDVLAAWRPADAPSNETAELKTLDSVFDWSWVELEELPRGQIAVLFARSGADRQALLTRNRWQVRVRPRLPDRVLVDYRKARRLATTGRPEESVAHWEAVMGFGEAARDESVRCWSALEIARVWRDAERWSEAESALREALELADASEEPFLRTLVWDAVGQYREQRGELDLADQAYRASSDLTAKRLGSGPWFARTLENRARVAFRRGDFGEADSFWQRAIDVYRAEAAGSLALARALHDLASAYLRRGRLEAAEPLYAEAIAIREELSSGGPELASSLNNLGLLAHQRGHLRQAEELLSRSLEIKRLDTLRGPAVASTLSNLGLVAEGRGDLAAAETYYRQALAIDESFAPNSSGVALTLSNLGNVANHRRDFPAAKAMYERALGIVESLSPDSLDVALVLNNLATVAEEQGELEDAELFLRRALEIVEREAPESPEVGRYLNNLGDVSRHGGDWQAARGFYLRAREILEHSAPETLAHSHVLHNLGETAREGGHLDEAELFLRQALAIREALAPASMDVARTLHALGLLYRERESLEEAVAFFTRCLDAIEAQADRLGGAQEIQAGFRASFRRFYRDLIDLHLARGDIEAAFHVLERSRAGLFLSLIAERDLVLGDGLARELESERHELMWLYQQIQGQLMALSTVRDGADVEHLRNQLRELRDRRALLNQRIRAESPLLAELRAPQPVTASQAREALDPGTVMLSYSLGDRDSHLFVVAYDQQTRVFTIPVSEAALRDEIAVFRQLIERPLERPFARQAIIEQAQRLYRLLVEPAQGQLEGSRRVLILPDGPLHLLPFAALVRKREAGANRGLDSTVPESDWQYLVEWKPLHAALSATVYAKLRERRSGGRPRGTGPELVAFADPQYGDRDPALPSLVWTREEASRIADHFKGRVLTFVGNAATEAQAKAVGTAVPYLHFACHGLLDEDSPLDSGLALSTPSVPSTGEDGRLQAWEIFEQVRLDTSLVVLSACNSGLGKEMGGEGLVGLTRAFQFAGASSVMASLWSISDEVTADLMDSFYGHLESGRNKDEALQAAQVELIHCVRGGREGKLDERGGIAISHPIFWASFQLLGDYRR